MKSSLQLSYDPNNSRSHSWRNGSNIPRVHLYDKPSRSVYQGRMFPWSGWLVQWCVSLPGVCCTAALALNQNCGNVETMECATWEGARQGRTIWGDEGLVGWKEGKQSASQSVSQSVVMVLFALPSSLLLQSQPLFYLLTVGRHELTVNLMRSDCVSTAYSLLGWLFFSGGVSLVQGFKKVCQVTPWWWYTAIKMGGRDA